MEARRKWVDWIAGLRLCFFLNRNEVFLASASIDAHGRYIKKRKNGSSLQVASSTRDKD
jgi:hypothetical protein